MGSARTARPEIPRGRRAQEALARRLLASVDPEVAALAQIALNALSASDSAEESLVLATDFGIRAW